MTLLKSEFQRSPKVSWNPLPLGLGSTSKELISMFDKNTGNPLDKTYLEKNLPRYLQHDIDGLLEGAEKGVSYYDCLWSELYGSINSAEVDELISEEQATYLRNKYLYEDDDEEND